MIHIGIQTKGILPECGIEDGMAAIRRAGFDRIDFNLDAFLKNSDIYNGAINSFFESSLDDLILYFGQYRDAMEKNGICTSQMHAPYPYFVRGRAKQNDYMMGNVIPKSIVIAEALGVPWMVLHPAKIQYFQGAEEEHRVNMEFFKALVPLLKQCHVGVCVEDLYESFGTRIVEGPCSDPKEAIWYVDTLNEYAGEELFGICLDTGHLQLTKRNPADYIKTVGSRLKILHLHENDAVGDLHQMPYTFGGNRTDGLNWDEIAEALKEISFDGTLSFETYPCMNSFPLGMEEAVLRTIYEIGVSFRKRIEN